MGASYSFASYFVLDVYAKLEGTWEVFSGSERKHSSQSLSESFSLAKRFCSITANCFGVKVEFGGVPYSIEFPIELRPNDSKDSFYVHKKENILGNFLSSIIVFKE